MSEKIISLRDVVVKDKYTGWRDQEMCDLKCPLCDYVEHTMGHQCWFLARIIMKLVGRVEGI
jgi:hypothetical protein